MLKHYKRWINTRLRKDSLVKPETTQHSKIKVVVENVAYWRISLLISYYFQQRFDHLFHKIIKSRK